MGRLVSSLIGLVVLFAACQGSIWPGSLETKPTLDTWTGPMVIEHQVLFIWTNQSWPGPVYLSGSFNAWQIENPEWELKEVKPGLKSRLVRLDPGRYFYKYSVDGELIPDPTNTNLQPDGYGDSWSLITVP